MAGVIDLLSPTSVARQGALSLSGGGGSPMDIRPSAVAQQAPPATAPMQASQLQGRPNSGGVGMFDGGLLPGYLSLAIGGTRGQQVAGFSNAYQNAQGANFDREVFDYKKGQAASQQAQEMEGRAMSAEAFAALYPEAAQELTKRFGKNGIATLMGSNQGVNLLNQAAARYSPSAMEAPKVQKAYSDDGREMYLQWDSKSGGWQPLGGEKAASSNGLEVTLPDGTRVAVGGPKLTETQSKQVMFADRMNSSAQIINGLEKDGYDPSSLRDNVAGNVPGGNYVVSEQGQKYQAAAKDWIAGALRLDSGAAVPETEFQRYFKTYFPQPGDSPEVILQKAASRVAFEDALRTASGGIADALAPKRLPDGATEEDITYTMEKYGLTREEVLERLGQ